MSAFDTIVSGGLILLVWQTLGLPWVFLRARANRRKYDLEGSIDGKQWDRDPYAVTLLWPFLILGIVNDFGKYPKTKRAPR